jgi:hypothetical protein
MPSHFWMSLPHRKQTVCVGVQAGRGWLVTQLSWMSRSFSWTIAHTPVTHFSGERHGGQEITLSFVSI